MNQILQLRCVSLHNKTQKANQNKNPKFNSLGSESLETTSNKRFWATHKHPCSTKVNTFPNNDPIPTYSAKD